MAEIIDKIRQYYRDYGFKKTVVHSVRKAIGAEQDEYERWLKVHLPSRKILERQTQESQAFSAKVSIVVPIYRTPRKYFLEMIQSVMDQSYANWELILSDGSGPGFEVGGFLTNQMKEDPRIVYLDHRKQGSIVENTNLGLERATGDYVALLDHDDLLTPDALYWCAKAVTDVPEIEIVYSDEDKISSDGKHYFQPHFKPDFNLDMLCSVNYICHLFFVKRSLIGEVGLLEEEYNGAQDYDLILRCAEIAKQIFHVPRILYHWRSHPESTAENPESKEYAFDAGTRAIQAHYDRIGVPAKVERGDFPGLYRTKYLWEERPLLTVIIPNKDQAEMLRRCVTSLFENNSYTNFEILIVENNSVEPETFALYEELKAKDERIRVVEYKGEFNYSAINNFAVESAKGDYYLLLNNDTCILRDDSIWNMLSVCMREDVGCVGARLYYEDGTIQHAGVITGFGGIAGHAFVGLPHDALGYFARIIITHDLNAVTAACMVVKKSVFHEVGGFEESLPVNFNDTDLCLKIRRAGYLVVYEPSAELTHSESKSRGRGIAPEHQERFHKEIATFAERWPDVAYRMDPYYNPNLSMEKMDFGLKSPNEMKAEIENKKRLERG